jgi:hypothetical protein
MKKNSLNILGAALLLATTLALSGCGFAAKNLAKQTQDAVKKMTELQKKAADIEEKAAALSAKDRRTYQEELARLGVTDTPEWLFNDEAALLSGAPEETEEAGGGILGLIGGLFGGGSRASGGILSGGKPTPLAANATHRQAMAKYDQVVAYTVNHPPAGTTAAEIEAMKIALNAYRGQFQLLGLAWSDREVRDGMIEMINDLIADLE